MASNCCSGDDAFRKARAAAVALAATASPESVHVADLKALLSRSFDDALQVFRHLWEEIGIGEAQRTERMTAIVSHIHSLLDEMVSEERALKDKLLRNVHSYRSELELLSVELHVPLPETDSLGGKMAILQLEKELRQRVEALTAEKVERLRLFEQLRDNDQRLCDALSTTPFYIPSGVVPTREQLHLLEGHVAALARTKDERQKKFFAERSKIIGLYEELGHEPSTAFEQDVAIEEPDCFVLSNDNMEELDRLHEGLVRQQHERLALDRELRERLTTLWLRLELPAAELNDIMSSHSGHRLSDVEALQSEIKKCEQLKLRQVRRFVESIRTDLQQWWTKCYFSNEQRIAFAGFESDDYDEELLRAHEAELERVQRYYEANEEMLQKVERRAELWARMLEFDAKERDPARYTNRGGGLLKEEKERKQILRELPKVEEQLKQTVEAWEASHGRDFLCNGVKFTDFCRQQWEEYHRRKDEEKQERQKKSKEGNTDGLFGNRPTTTPCKRRLNGGPASAVASATTPASKVTPAKLRKLNDPSTPQTPLTITRIAQKSVFASPLSLPHKGLPLGASTTKLNEGAACRTPGRAAVLAATRTPKHAAAADARTPGSRQQVRPVPGAASASSSAACKRVEEAKQKGARDVLRERQNVDELVPTSSVLTYHDFKEGLCEQSKQNWRSSELPQKP